MERMKQKLNSRRGASILLALVFFLLCAMVGAVIFASASANVSKVQQRREEQTAYLSVSSAAQLLRQAMEDVTYERGETRRDYGCQNAPGSLGLSPQPEETEYAKLTGTLNGGALTEVLTEGADRIFLDRCQFSDHHRPFGAKPYAAAFTVEPEADRALCPVAVQLTMDSEGNLAFELSAQDSGNLYQMTLTFHGDVAEETTIDASRKCTHTYQVTNALGEDETVSVNYTAPKTTHTVTIRWNTPVIAKGVLPHA